MPKKYDPDVKQDVLEAKAQGMKLDDIKKKFKVSVPTIYKWMNEPPTVFTGTKEKAPAPEDELTRLRRENAVLRQTLKALLG